MKHVPAGRQHTLNKTIAINRNSDAIFSDHLHFFGQK
jgi:hypothetical protein